MRIQASPIGKPALFSAIFLIAALCSWTQGTGVQPLITQPIDESKLTILPGNTHPLARAQLDLGLAPDNLPMDRMLLVLKRSPQQEAALQKWMAQQLDKSSPNYHKWLTAAQFGQMFGPSDQDIQTITRWLETHGFTGIHVATGRTTIEFSGDAAQVQAAFHTAIHKFVVSGAQHWANVQDPAIPAAITPAVAGVASLHNFFPNKMSHVASAAARSRTAARNPRSIRPQFTFTDSRGNQWFALGPTDFATIYNILPLWNLSIDGSGETIAILSDSNIDIQDARDFKSIFGFPPNDPVVTVNGTDPGLTSDEIEAILDVQWSGAVAKGATVNLVVSESTNAAFGGDLSATCVVNLAAPCSSTPPAVMSYSFGQCELFLGTTQNAFYNSTWAQAAAEGITVVVSSGDDGSAGCDFADPTGPAVQPAQFGLAVSGLASTPFNVAVGGTEFNDPNPSQFFNSTNTPPGQNSARSYVPEMTYNDTCTNSVVFTFFGFSGANAAQDACNDARVQANFFVQPVGASGGVSRCTTSDGTNRSSCSGGYAKPCWQGGPITSGCTQQSGITTPADGKRDLPDVSLFAGDGTISGSFYVVCNRDFPGINGQACNLSNDTFLFAGGTSVGAQAFAGIMALVDQAKGSAQGNADPTLYSLAAGKGNTCVSAASPPSTCVFYDVTTGTIAMPCQKGTPDCVLSRGVLGPSLRPGKPNAWSTVMGLTLVCLFFLGVTLLRFPGRARRWGAGFALLAMAFLIGGIGCAGNGGSNGGGGGNQTVGVLSGYNAGTGYDLATGLGTVNVDNLVNQWP